MKHKTYKGRSIDMEELRRKHTNTVASGNMGVNAAGDTIGPGGEIIEPAKRRAIKHYAATETTEATMGLKGASNEKEETALDEASKAPVQKKNPKGTGRTPKAPKVERETESGDIVLEEKAKD